MVVVFAWLFAFVSCGRPGPAQTDAPQETAAAIPASNAPSYLCPMDKDIRSKGPGQCPRCGMNLVTAIPDPVEYQLELTATPPPRPSTTVHLKFEVFDPWKGNLVTRFTLVHERLFHAFIVSSGHARPCSKWGSMDCARTRRACYPEASSSASRWRVCGRCVPKYFSLTNRRQPGPRRHAGNRSNHRRHARRGHEDTHGHPQPRASEAHGR